MSSATQPRAVVRFPRSHHRTAYVFIAPFMALFVAVLVLPLAYAFYLSLFREQLVGGTVFVGLGNYAKALTDPLFLGGVVRMAVLLAVQVPIMLGLALVFALALDSGRVRLARTVRLGIFVPYAVPSVVAALMWGYLYGRDFGLFTQLAEALGLPAPDFLGSGLMLASIANIVSWEFIGYNMIILYAALQAVPSELREAAAVDGAREVQIAWHVKVPAIRGAILLTVIFSVIGTFQLFNEPSIMADISPAVIRNDYSPNLYAFNLAFTNQDFTYSAAVSFLLGLVTVAMSTAVFLVTRRGSRQS